MSAALLTIPGIVIGIIDGDTVKVQAHPWVAGWTIETNVRVSGIDTPELKGHASCAAEAELGAVAKTKATVEFMGQPIMLIAVEPDKYGDRVISRVVRVKDDLDWSAMMLASGLAKPYDGGKKQGWCP